MYETVEKHELHVRLTKLEDLFDTRVKEPGDHWRGVDRSRS